MNNENPFPDPLPTSAEIDELLAFLPRLFKEGFKPVEDWHANHDKITFPYPIYHPDVIDFIKVASQEVWCDFKYRPEETSKMLMDTDLIANASLAQMKTMLTFCVRGERFSDGHWAAMIEHGYLRRLLERLAEIRESK